MGQDTAIGDVVTGGLDVSDRYTYVCVLNAGGLRRRDEGELGPVSHLVWDQKVPGSNPGAPGMCHEQLEHSARSLHWVRTLNTSWFR
jgi:hypothetical protein